GFWADEIPSQTAFAKSGMKHRAELLWRAAAGNLTSMGFNVNFAPVLDMCGKKQISNIGIRSFGSDKNLIADLGGRFIKGMREGGIACFAKHFPGLGKTPVDSHFSIPIINTTRDRLLKDDIHIFKSLIRKGMPDGILSAHALYPDLDTVFPASISGKIISGILYEKLKFKGIAITDDMDMAAIKKTYDTSYFARKSVEAGSHLILACHNKSPIHKILSGLSKIKSETAEKRLKDIDTWKQKVLVPDKRCGNVSLFHKFPSGHIRSIARKTVEITVRNKIKGENYIFLCFVRGHNRGAARIRGTDKMLYTVIKKTFRNAKILFYPQKPDRDELTKNIPVIITANAYKDAGMAKSLSEIIRAAGKNCFCFAIEDPYDTAYFSSCAVTGRTYSPDRYSVSEILGILKEKRNEI
ncbi:MAG: glycoside hydrolase family 3 N-terminal domain-containing protein, partial [bacterium]|nr:glycoside hydrolase family 3 N-terminal domain-containing protein [bacterium]